MMSSHELALKALTDWLHEEGYEEALKDTFAPAFLNMFASTIDAAVEEKTKSDRDDLEQRFINIARAQAETHSTDVARLQNRFAGAEAQVAELHRRETYQIEQIAREQAAVKEAQENYAAAVFALNEARGTQRMNNTLQRQNDEARAALTKINAIRNSIVDSQTINWSTHIYPLVAALDAAGYEGVHYENAGHSTGTLIERYKAMTQLAATAQLALTKAEEELARKTPRAILAAAADRDRMANEWSSMRLILERAVAALVKHLRFYENKGGPSDEIDELAYETLLIVGGDASKAANETWAEMEAVYKATEVLKTRSQLGHESFGDGTCVRECAGCTLIAALNKVDARRGAVKP